jgi:type I restriction enzyme, R subunit
MTTPRIQEEYISQIPALILLCKLGYQYLSPSEALKLRNNKESNVILEEVLENWLIKNNSINTKGKTISFSTNNIQKAIYELKNPVPDGLIHTNQKIYDLLILGKSFEQNIDGDTKSFSLNYIDWNDYSKNIFHVTEEFSVTRRGLKETARPDLVLFVNGIPLCVIECKRPDQQDSLMEAVSQQIRNQGEEYIPHLFYYSQLLLAINKSEAKCATVGTISKFWAVWKESGEEENILNSPFRGLGGFAFFDKIFGERFKSVKQEFENLNEQGRLITEQDKALYYLCRPERLLELTHKFIVFDGGEKKIARYQQYFAVQNALERIKITSDSSLLTDGVRSGGVVWHTQGSGKSLTMVMLARAIALEPEIKNEKVLVVTDRVDLDKQIWDTFNACQKEAKRAISGKDLLELIEANKSTVITTVIDKFESALNVKDYLNPDPNIFVLIDESHRSVYGSNNAMMRKIFPNACYIGFTGTPLLKTEKNTAHHFGGYIHKYTIDQAVQDEAVVPLIYEGRHVVQEVDQKAVDNWFERVTRDLTDDQRKDLKKKFSSAKKLNETDQKIQQVSFDISEHFKKNWKNTGFKAQLVAPSKIAAVKYKKFLDEWNMVTSEVLISAPDTREGNDEVDEDKEEDNKKIVLNFWKKMMNRFKNTEEYQNYLISNFKKEDEPEIIIVVDKLLTGFDAPRNTVLYLTKPLKEHSLLQAIARVNRLCEGKQFGYIVDYYGLLGNLDQALNNYSSLEGFAEEDIAGALISIGAEVSRLSQTHSDLNGIFKTLKNKADQEEYIQYLRDELIREEFYQALNDYANCLRVALSSSQFITDTPLIKQADYKNALKFFHSVRAEIKQRYSESINFKDYEARIEDLLNKHVKSDEIICITEPVSIFDKEKFQEELDKVQNPVAKADRIASRTQKMISEKIAEDPVFYTKFSELIKEAIKAYLEKRLSESEYLKKVTAYMEAVRNKKDDDLPSELIPYDHAQAYYRLLNKVLKQTFLEHDLKDLSIDLALVIDQIIKEKAHVDWQKNIDLQNEVWKEMNLKIYESLKNKGLKFEWNWLEELLQGLLDIAKNRVIYA